MIIFLIIFRVGFYLAATTIISMTVNVYCVCALNFMRCCIIIIIIRYILQYTRCHSQLRTHTFTRRPIAVS